MAKSAPMRPGWGKYGQLGCGPDIKQAKVPTEVKTASPVTSVSCGEGLPSARSYSHPLLYFSLETQTFLTALTR